MARSKDLIVFARQPHFGVGKTRLAARTSKQAAWQFQRRQILDLRKLACDPRWHFRLCWAHQQGPGDLGDRLTRALAGPPGRRRLIIGADTVGLRAHHVAHAFDLLDGARHVVGPCPDGGFWGIGSRGPVRLSGIRWSSPYTLADTLACLNSYAVADTLEDLD